MAPFDFPTETFFDEHVSKQTMSKTQRKKLRRQQKQKGQEAKLTLQTVQPLTKNQEKVFDAYVEGYHLFLHGAPGTGKTFLACALALEDVLDEESPFNKVIIIRSNVAGREQGFLPGTHKQKMAEYENAYKSVFSNLFNRDDAYDILTNKNIVEFLSTSFLRGNTFENAIVVVDEVQNMGFQELHTIITRLGDKTNIFFCGDIGQNDLWLRKNDVSGLPNFMQIVSQIKSFKFVEFGIEDIVRSGLVAEYMKEYVRFNESRSV